MTTRRHHSPSPIAPCRLNLAKLRAPIPESPVTRHAFSLVEILVTITLMSFIVLGLMAMFNQTQRAFQSSMAQTDVLESGRAVMDLLARELEQISPSNLSTGINFYSWYIPRTPVPARPLTQELPGEPPNSATRRTNVLQEFFFLTRSNQYWSGIGYLVGTPALGAGTLYRFDTYAHNSRPDLIANFSQSFQAASLSNLHRVAEGIVHLRLRAFAANGGLIAPIGAFTNVINATSRWDLVKVKGEIQYSFWSNAVPAYLEVELGILESKVLERFRSMENSPDVARAFLEKQAGRVHLFRQRVPVRNVDPSVYQ